MSRIVSNWINFQFRNLGTSTQSVYVHKSSLRIRNVMSGTHTAMNFFEHKNCIESLLPILNSHMIVLKLCEVII